MRRFHASRRRQAAVALAAAAVIILSAPFAQQAFTEIARRWPAQFRAIIISASAVPAAAVFVVACWRIRDRRLLRLSAVALGFAGGLCLILAAGLTFSESFHFIEYGALAALFYPVWRSSGGDVRDDDWSVLALPVLAAAIAGTFDEWFQWFIPIRAGEARDVLLNVAAAGCGLLVAVGIAMPPRVRLRLDGRSRRHVGAYGAAAVAVFAGFFQTVHVGHDVRDPEIGSFRSRFTAAELADAANERRERWRTKPPVVQRRLGREDHYLTEALWHVQRRNQAWESADAAAAWRENRILEKFYAPVLDTPTYAGAGGHRWPAAQRAEAAARGAAPPSASATYAYPLYVWPDRIF